MKIVVIAHNAKAFDLHFILNRAFLMKWQVELIMNGLKIMCMRVEHLVFLDSASFLPFALRKLPEAFGLTVGKSWYPHYFNMRANLDYLGNIPDIAYYGNEVFENLYYVPVENRAFPDITILVIDTVGNAIAFPDSQTPAKVVLHFRRVLQ